MSALGTRTSDRDGSALQQQSSSGLSALDSTLGGGGGQESPEMHQCPGEPRDASEPRTDCSFSSQTPQIPKAPSPPPYPDSLLPMEAQVTLPDTVSFDLYLHLQEVLLSIRVCIVVVAIFSLLKARGHLWESISSHICRFCTHFEIWDILMVLLPCFLHILMWMWEFHATWDRDFLW